MDKLPTVIVCGGRDFDFNYLMYNYLDYVFENRGWITEKDELGNFLPKVKIVSGGAKGADEIAIEYAILNHQQFKEYPADWETYGKAAGPIRNQQMLDEEKPDLVIAFPGGKGTKNMVALAELAGVEVLKLNG